MVSLLPPTTPSRRRAAPAAEAPRPLPASGLVAAGRAAALGLLAVTVVVLVGWVTAADTGASATEAVGSAVLVWLVAHGTELAVPGGRFGLVPLGLSAVPAALLFAAGARAARGSAVRGLRAAVALTAVLVGSYAVLTAFAALLARTESVRPQPVSAFLGAAALALLAGGAGVARGAGAWGRWWWRLPSAVRLLAAGTAAAVCTFVAGGALVAAAALARHHERATDLTRALDLGATGGLLVLLVCVTYVPTAAVWGAAFAAGSGFAVGAGTSVTPAGADLGAVPSLPLLAALPADGPLPAWSLLVLCLPVSAGAVAGLLVHRGDARLAYPLLDRWSRVLGLGAALGVGTGAALAALSVLANGPAGPGRLAVAGPTPWSFGLLVAGEVALTATLTLFGCRRRLLQRPGRAAHSS